MCKGESMTAFRNSNLTKENLRRLAHIILLGAWALIQYSLGNKIYGLFIIVFYLALLIYRQSYFTLIAIPALVLVLFDTPMIDVWVQLKKSNMDTVQHLTPSLRTLFTPNSGQEVLPDQVQNMLSLIQNHHVPNYRLSKQLTSDPLIRERIKESAWPVKTEKKSAYLLSLNGEIKNHPACIIIDQREDVVLAHCP